MDQVFFSLFCQGQSVASFSIPFSGLFGKIFFPPPLGKGCCPLVGSEKHPPFRRGDLSGCFSAFGGAFFFPRKTNRCGIPFFFRRGIEALKPSLSFSLELRFSCGFFWADVRKPLTPFAKKLLFVFSFFFFYIFSSEPPFGFSRIHETPLSFLPPFPPN